MSNWEQAIEQFITEWRQHEDVIGILVCGSYITGFPSKRSDLDIHIVTHNQCEWRERGNKVINGILIEYFVNPVKQIKAYFEQDYNNRSTMSMVQFLTGKVYDDRLGLVEELKNEARKWKERPFKPMDKELISLKQYHIWDAYDNLLDCYESNRNDFQSVYFNSLYQLYDQYCSILAIESEPHYKVMSYFTDPYYINKYLKAPFPDSMFKQLYLQAVIATTRLEQITLYTKLNEHVLNQFDGFLIDGWSFRSKLDV